MASSSSSLSLSYFSLALLLVLAASDPDPIRQLCVADLNSTILVDGSVCKDPSNVTADDYFSSLLTSPINTNNTLGVEVTLIIDSVFPGLNTQGLSIARLAFAPSGVNPPHNHPRGAEILYLVEGIIQAGFISDNRLFQKVVRPGELFIFPRGLVHFQINLSKNKSALAISALGSQNPGRTDVAFSLFSTTPPISDKVLQTTLQVRKGEVDRLRTQVATTLDAPKRG